MILQDQKAVWILLLHCHLPFVRHPEYDEFLEENWLFEAISETYLPLLECFNRLRDSGVDFQITVSLSPPLCEMLADELLGKRCAAYLEKRVEFCRRELQRLGGTDFETSVKMYYRRYSHQEEVYGEHAGKAVLQGFKDLNESGHVELITSAATHALLPICHIPAAAAAQIEQGCRCHQKHFGRRPAGFWLPECAFSPDIAPPLLDSGIQYSFLESHGVLLANPSPPAGVFAPVSTPEGLLLFARDPQTSRQVWSAEEGYPGDPLYREFYRDAGYDAPLEHVRPFLNPFGNRHQLGLKYHRISGDMPEKLPYDPEAAGKRAREHARHFVSRLEHQAEELSHHLDNMPAIVSPYDAELFGHWWHEGPWFLECVLQEMHSGRHGITTGTAAFFRKDQNQLHVCTPSPSTWGFHGYYESWISGSNDWVYRHLAAAEARMVQLAGRCRNGDPEIERILKQCIRELMLAQSSDWPFLIGTGTAPHYATERLKTHFANFWKLAHWIDAGSVESGELEDMERRNNIFSEICCDLFRPEP